MRKSDVRVGGIYTDRKGALREVIDQGSHLMADSQVADKDGIRYRVLASLKGGDIGRESSMTRAGFVDWAVAEVATGEIETIKLASAGAQLARSLTQAQTAFMRTIEPGTPASTDIDCNRQEMRMVRTLVGKGIIVAAPVAMGRDQWFFKYQLTELGASLLAAIYEHGEE